MRLFGHSVCMISVGLSQKMAALAQQIWGLKMGNENAPYILDCYLKCLIFSDKLMIKSLFFFFCLSFFLKDLLPQVVFLVGCLFCLFFCFTYLLLCE